MSEEKKQELKEYHKQRYQKQKSLKNNDLWLLCKILWSKRFLGFNLLKYI